MTPLGALRSFIAGTASVAVLAQDRIYAGSSLPIDKIGEMPRRCVLLKEQGGDQRPRLDTILEPRVEIVCFGASEEEASLLDLAVRQALKDLDRKVVDHVLLHNVLLSGGASQGRDPETGWPATRRLVTLRADEREVA